MRQTLLLNRDSLQNVQQLADRLYVVEDLGGQLQNNPADTTLAQELANACANAAWSQLFTRDYAGAVQSVERGLQVWPALTWGYTNLALGHLLQGTGRRRKKSTRSGKANPGK